MTEAGDYEPASWATSHDFGSARRSYASKSRAAASKAKAKVSTEARNAVLEKTVETECENPLVVCCDVTGSMGDWPEIMFSKLPYLEHEAKVYLGDDVEICFAAFGDFHVDSYPLQVRPFTSGEDLCRRMEELIIERGGGPQPESYELAAAYFAYNCEMPNAINPVMIIIGDEMSYEKLNKADAKRYGNVELPGVQTKEQILSSLKRKFDVYLILKVTDVRGNELRGRSKKVYESWEPFLGADHIAFLPDPNRVVDVIFGILGEASGKRDYFIEELKHRQLPDKDGEQKVETVLTAMNTIHIEY